MHQNYNINLFFKKLSKSTLNRNADYLYQQILNQLDVIDVDEIKKLLKNLLKAYPEHADALNDIGVLTFQEGNIEEAISYLEKANQIRPNDPCVLDNLSQIQNNTLNTKKYNISMASDAEAVTRTALLSIIMLCPDTPLELHYSLRSLSLQAQNLDYKLDVFLLENKKHKFSVKDYAALNIHKQDVDDLEVGKILLEYILNTKTKFCGVFRGGFCLAPEAIKIALIELEADSSLAVVASVIGELDEAASTISTTNYLTFNEYQAGLVIIKKEAIELCSTCLRDNSFTVDSVLKTLFTSFPLLTLKVTSSQRVIAWPLWHKNVESDEDSSPDIFMRHSVLLNSINKVTSYRS